MNVNSLRAVIAVWLNASQWSRIGVGMKCKVPERANGLDTALCVEMFVHDVLSITF